MAAIVRPRAAAAAAALSLAVALCCARPGSAGAGGGLNGPTTSTAASTASAPTTLPTTTTTTTIADTTPRTTRPVATTRTAAATATASATTTPVATGTTGTTVKEYTKPRSTKKPSGQTTPLRTTPRPKPTELPPSAFSSLTGGCYNTTRSGRLSQKHVEVLMYLLDLQLKQFGGKDAFGQANHPLVAGSVRLAFHACVGDSCGGCINVNNPANNGLDITISALTVFRDKLLQVPQFADCTLSYADLWQATAVAALTISTFDKTNAKVCTVPVVFGRTDCATAPYTDDIIPYPDRRWTIDPLLAFAAKLNLTAQQFVALLGMHSLGVVRDFNGRVMAQWDKSPDAAKDSTYFQTIANQAKIWTAVPLNFKSNSTPTMYSFTKDPQTKRFMFLTADFALGYNITEYDPDATGRPTTALINCPYSSTYKYVNQFATNTAAWLGVFCGAWNILTTRGYAPGTLLPGAAVSG